VPSCPVIPMLNLRGWSGSPFNAGGSPKPISVQLQRPSGSRIKDREQQSGTRLQHFCRVAQALSEMEELSRKQQGRRRNMYAAPLGKEVCSATSRSLLFASPSAGSSNGPSTSGRQQCIPSRGFFQHIRIPGSSTFPFDISSHVWHPCPFSRIYTNLRAISNEERSFSGLSTFSCIA
jgi:hypothetical protein